MQPTCPPNAAFVVCGPVSAGNRMVAAALIRGGCSGEATAYHAWSYNCRMPVDAYSDPRPCLIRHNPFEGYPTIDDQLRAAGFAPRYIYVIRDRTANVASSVRHGHSIDKVGKDVVRRNLSGMLRAEYFELFPSESLMLGGDVAAASLCARLGLSTDTTAPIVVDRVARSFENTDWKYWELRWFGDYGFYPVDRASWPYDDSYFAKYEIYATTDIGAKLTRMRVDLVRKYWRGPVVDFGIGAGTFVTAHGDARGYDVCPAAVRWLDERGLFENPWLDGFRTPVMTFWDSLEHELELDRLLARVDQYVFVSIPIFGNYDDVCRSKHFRIDEHYWYFTRHGFIEYMKERGFHLVYDDKSETTVGRDSIGTFVFSRVRPTPDSGE